MVHSEIPRRVMQYCVKPMERLWPRKPILHQLSQGPLKRSESQDHLYQIGL